MSEVVSKIYGVSGMTVNTCVAVYYVSYLFFIGPIIYWIDNYGTTWPLKFYALSSIIGVWVRYVLLKHTESFPIVILPTIFMSVLSPATSLALS